MKLKRIFSIVIVALLLTVNVFAQQAIRVACIGDSITEGSGSSDRATASYPAILQKLLGDSYEVGNFGRSGRTLLRHGDFPYWDDPKFEASKAFAPDIVVIKLGTNDTKSQNWDAYGVEFEGDLRALVEVYRSLPSRPKIYLCYPVWGERENFRIRPQVVAGQVIPAIDRVAREMNISVIDLQTTLYGMPHLLRDGIHPNDLGYILVAKDVYDRIK